MRGRFLIDSDGRWWARSNASPCTASETTCSASPPASGEDLMGKAGIINIEREAEMSGPTHNKGVYILCGYLRGKYAQDKPITMRRASV